MIGWRWPTTEAPLAINQPYMVKLVVRCRPQDPSTLTTLADLRRQSPNDPALQAKWSWLLTEVNLGAIANQPIVNRPEVK
jgi:Domain of Unknown Function (DUF928)